MKRIYTLVCCFALILCGCISFKNLPIKNRIILPSDLLPPGACTNCPPNTNWPPPFNPPVIDTNKLWLSIEQNSVSITVIVNNANPDHLYYLWGIKDMNKTNWTLATFLQGSSFYSFPIPKIFSYTNSPILFFRTEDISQ